MRVFFRILAFSIIFLLLMEEAKSDILTKEQVLCDESTITEDTDPDEAESFQLDQTFRRRVIFTLISSKNSGTDSSLTVKLQHKGTGEPYSDVINVAFQTTTTQVNDIENLHVNLSAIDIKKSVICHFDVEGTDPSYAAKVIFHYE